MTILPPRLINLAGLPVRRLLPSRDTRSVGPWVFFDHMGPHTFEAGSGVDIIPHPHIGLATVTYLFDGEIVHRDSLGNTQPIRPGAINLMTAGRGIAHSERTPAASRGNASSVHGLQLWLGLPADREEDGPAFDHYDGDSIPEVAISGGSARVLIGSAFGAESPVAVSSTTLYAELVLKPDARVRLPEQEEMAVYPVSGMVMPSDGDGVVETGSLAVLAPGTLDRELVAVGDTRLILLAGEPIGPRFMWWNFVSSRVERIEQAKADWKEGRFGVVAGDQDEFAPLPEIDRHSRMNRQKPENE